MITEMIQTFQDADGCNRTVRIEIELTGRATFSTNDKIQDVEIVCQGQRYSIRWNQIEDRGTLSVMMDGDVAGWLHNMRHHRQAQADDETAEAVTDEATWRLDGCCPILALRPTAPTR
jgi:hypothetical protein